jgi:hypothetical protein
MLDYLADWELGMIDENDDNSDELQTRLNENLRFTLNSINIIIGRTGSGKTRTVIKEIMKLEYLPPKYHYLIYITYEENDKTFYKYQHCIDLPILRVEYEDVYYLLCKIIKAKTADEQIRDGTKTGRREERVEILELSELPNFKCTNLHTLILFDDATPLSLLYTLEK